MNVRLLAVAIERDTDVVLVRRRARQVAELIGFERQDQSRITTAVSEIARNAFEYAGGGRVELRLAGAGAQPLLEIAITDKGPGIRELEDVLAGTHVSATGMGIGIRGARRLMDEFEIESHPGTGTSIVMRKRVPRRAAPLTQASLRKIAETLARDEGLDPVAEVARQNQELLVSLDELRRREDELVEVNQELQDTNRGVVALYAELEERAEHLRRADELKSRFLSHMSHEFRTPLNSILALARLLLGRVDGDLGEEQERQVKYILKSAESLTELVNDLLDLAKVEAGKVDVKPAEFTVETMFGTLRGLMRPLLSGDAVTLVFEDADGMPPLVTDESKVAQILRNFISNAIKFTAEGEVRVWADLADDGETITFHVRDTGTGVAPENVDIIFQEFAQVGAPVRKDIKGTGLGLPLSRRLAELIGGRVNVESTLGEGSTFRLIVPRRYSSIRRRDASILVIDDEEAARYIVRQMLREEPFKLVDAIDGSDAVRCLRDAVPDAILLDLNMPGMSGFEVIEYLRRDGATRDIPVIVLTSSVIDEAQRERLGHARQILSKAALNRATLASALTRVLPAERVST
jgi:signal transduction histidine kinase/ActR/RegA family two-component response regulator